MAVSPLSVNRYADLADHEDLRITYRYNQHSQHKSNFHVAALSFSKAVRNLAKLFGIAIPRLVNSQSILAW